MATYTDNYQLTKPLYSETADVAAINNNMDKIDDIMHASQVSLAPAYDQNETYNTGDVVMYEFLMYECLEDDVTGVWDATKWQRTTAGEHGGGSAASEVSYDNTNSGLEADNVQDALDEIVENIPREEITGEASGAIASFADGSANPLKSLVVDINPVQAGSGTPSPSNIRPISGWSSVEVTVADDTTDPTTEETYEITLGQTVYGGKLNVTTGELTVDRAMVDLGTLNWLYSTADTRFFTTNLTDIKKVTDTSIVMNGLCSHYDIVAYRYVNTTSALDSVMGLYSTSTTNYLAIKDTRYTDTTTFTQAVNGVQLVYELETPTTISLTPTQVDSLLGNNNIWADTGDSDVVYVRDINKAFNILWNAVMNSNSGTRSLNLMKGAISETKENIEEPIKEEEETKEGNDENKR